MFKDGIFNNLDAMIAYFARGAKEQEYTGQLQRGLELCYEWEKLTEKEKIRESEIEEFLDKIYSENEPGSGWMELSFQFKIWARGKGFSAKDRTYPSH
ncbi:hypothetical protein [Rubellicoccus peritrichatus]|uniref:Uncharacterized protein n=1 Tax=Rubellicoccus peritrichatus TaxID=3080537 RepID=A0AAQ3LBA5_9BACT|nr:hypothetical protein [Puniceicoccus sp. CR14]WOO41137.1 hypothetical protein RZN69_21155 [Puniceicoccus sp. CR14]